MRRDLRTAFTPADKPRNERPTVNQRRAVEVDGFALFGEALAVCTAGGSNANDRTAVRFYNAATLEFAAKDGHPSSGVFRVQPARPPLLYEKLEWRPISSNTLVPLGGRRFLVVVATSGGDAPYPSRTRAFLTDGSQGVNYRRGTWHQPVLTLGVPTDFVMLGRTNPERDCDVAPLLGKIKMRVVV